MEVEPATFDVNRDIPLKGIQLSHAATTDPPEFSLDRKISFGKHLAFKPIVWKSSNRKALSVCLSVSNFIKQATLFVPNMCQNMNIQHKVIWPMFFIRQWYLMHRCTKVTCIRSLCTYDDASCNWAGFFWFIYVNSNNTICYRNFKLYLLMCLRDTHKHMCYYFMWGIIRQ